MVWYSPAFGDACGKVPLENMRFRIAALGRALMNFKSG